MSLLFQTYPRYYDRPSRRGVQKCIAAIVADPSKTDTVALYIKLLEEESAKNNIASSSAFVLVEWFSELVQELSNRPQTWDTFGGRITIAYAATLETCIAGEKRESVKQSALVVTRRAYRVLLRKLDDPKDVLTPLVTGLAAKSSSPKPRHSILLGVLAGVSARLPNAKAVLEDLKKEYYGFYVREIVGSRILLAPEVAGGLHDFFESFASAEDLIKEVAPSIEKALLRAPEVILNGLITPMAESLPANVDLSQVLSKHLLKPIVSNVKSSNAAIRSGALATFSKFAARAQDEAITDKIAEELLNPLKQKATSADQKVIYAQMIASLNWSATIGRKVPPALASIALKESSEAAIAAEISALTKLLRSTIEIGNEPDPVVSDAYVKGVADKRPAVRISWGRNFGQLVWGLPADQLAKSSAIPFIARIVDSLAVVWKEVIANPLPSTQNGLVVLGYIFITLTSSKVFSFASERLKVIASKYEVVQKTLSTGSVPSFLLNQRIYTKITNEEDLIWAVRALASISSHLAVKENPTDLGDSWSQAFIYSITAAGLPRSVRQEAVQSLTEAYAENPEKVGHIVIEGLWSWYRRIESNEKDTAAIASKTGTTELRHVIRSIYPTPTEVAQLAKKPDESVVEQLLLEALVLARSTLIPTVSWIDLCLRTGIDPGNLVSKNCSACMNLIIATTQVSEKSYPLRRKAINFHQDPISKQYPAIQRAAYEAAADLAFVSPDAAVPVIIAQIESDLDPKQLQIVGPTEAAIFRTPEGTPFIDVLAKNGQDQALDKSAKDYDTLKWEKELRAQLAQKKGQTRKLTSDESAKVNAQLEKEAAIRRDVAAVEANLRRGVGIVHGLASGPSSETQPWIGPAVDLLIDVIREGAGLLLGNAPADAFLKCSDCISPRLGVLRPFIGIATLRSLGNAYLPDELQQEPLIG